jgi:hypothetical protein
LTQFASVLNVPFSDLKVHATLLWDNRYKYNIAAISQASLGFVFTVSINSDEPVERIKDLFRQAEEGCYASDAIRNPVPMRAHLIQNGQEILVDKRGGEVPDVSAQDWHTQSDPVHTEGGPAARS